jgi:hypothetical protein
MHCVCGACAVTAAGMHETPIEEDVHSNGLSMTRPSGKRMPVHKICTCGDQSWRQ